MTVTTRGFIPPTLPVTEDCKQCSEVPDGVRSAAEAATEVETTADHGTVTATVVTVRIGNQELTNDSYSNSTWTITDDTTGNVETSAEFAAQLAEARAEADEEWQVTEIEAWDTTEADKAVYEDEV